MSMNPAKPAATRFLKKLFCTAGKSPDRRTKVFISAKQKAAMRIQRIPFCLCFMISAAFRASADNHSGNQPAYLPRF